MTNLLKNKEGYNRLYEYYSNKFNLLDGNTDFKEEDFVIPSSLMNDISVKFDTILRNLKTSFGNYVISDTSKGNISALYDNLYKFEIHMYNLAKEHFVYGDFYEEIYNFILEKPYKYICLFKSYNSIFPLPFEHQDVLKDLNSYSPEGLKASSIVHFEHLYELIDAYNKMECTINEVEGCLKATDYYISRFSVNYVIHYREKLLMDVYDYIQKHVSNFEYNDKSKNEVRKLLFLLKVELFEKK